MFSKINSYYHDDFEILDITLKTQHNLVTPADYDSEDSAEDVPSSESSDGDNDTYECVNDNDDEDDDDNDVVKRY
jgi:hypothetical protein